MIAKKKIIKNHFFIFTVTLPVEIDFQTIIVLPDSIVKNKKIYILFFILTHE